MGLLGLPAILGIPQDDSASVRVEKFGLEESKLKASYGCWTGRFVLLNPNLKEDKAPPVAFGGIAGIRSTHASCAILSAVAAEFFGYTEKFRCFL